MLLVEDRFNDNLTDLVLRKNGRRLTGVPFGTVRIVLAIAPILKRTEVEVIGAAPLQDMRKKLRFENFLRVVEFLERKHPVEI